MTTRALSAIALSIALVVTSALPVVAGSDYLRGGFGVQPTSTPYTTPSGQAACHMYTRIWLQELGTSGVTSLKAKFYLRGANDPGLPGLAYQEAGWFETAEFPDDYRSYYAWFETSFNTFAGGRYKIYATLVGVRPGLWHLDRKWKVTLGEAGCDGISGGS